MNLHSSETICDLIFVYGTLRSESSYSAQSFMERHCVFLGNAPFRGKMYDVGHYPAVVPSSKLADRVKGEVYRMKMPDFLLAYLDHYECCSQYAGEYVRQQIEIELKTKRNILAWIYLYNRPVGDLKQIYSGDYVKYINDYHLKTETIFV